MNGDKPVLSDPTKQYSREIAVLDYEAAKEEAIERLRFQNELASSLIKNLLLINGGAIVAILTFVGNTKSDLSRMDLKGSLVLFAAGCVFCIVASILGFFAGERFHDATISEAWNAQLRMNGESERHSVSVEIKCGRLAYRFAVLFVLTSVLAFVFGAFNAIDALL